MSFSQFCIKWHEKFPILGVGPCSQNRGINHGPEVIKLFLAQLNWAWNFNCSSKLKYKQMKKFLALSLSDDVFILLINVKMPTIVGILTFMSRMNFVLSWVEHGKSFITSGTGIIYWCFVVYSFTMKQRQESIHQSKYMYYLKDKIQIFSSFMHWMK